MSLILKKIILSVIILIIIACFILIISAIYMGVFATAEISRTETGPYYYIAFSQKNLYQNTDIKINFLRNMLEEKNIQHLHPLCIFSEDPLNIPEDQLYNQTAYIILDSVEIDSPFTCKKIESRQVAIASINAHPIIASYKTYPELHIWLRRNNYKLDRTKLILEHYNPDGSVGVEFPITK